MSSDATELHIGKRLYNAGWRQGSILRHPSLKFARNKLTGGNDVVLKHRSVKVNNGECLVLISQNCDIVADKDREPYVEALVCTKEDPARCEGLIELNSSRYFVVDHDDCLIARAIQRVHIEKAVLEQSAPESWPSSDEHRESFIRWLARRYIRPDHPDAFVYAFQNPVRDLFKSLRDTDTHLVAAFSRLVHEIRITKPSTDGPPFDVHVVLILRESGSTQEEADAIDSVQSAIYAEVASDPRIQSLQFDASTLDEISAAYYLATDPINLDYYTIGGDEDEDSAEMLPLT